MYTLSTGQPFLEQCSGPSHYTTLLTLDERKAFALGLEDSDESPIPLCIDHAGAEGADEQAGAFRVPNRLVIGRLVHALVRENGQLLLASEIYYERPEVKRIVRDIESGSPWGVSLCTDYLLRESDKTVHGKKITHVGVTKVPEFGEDGNTWMHLVAMSPATFYRELHEQVVRHEPGIFMSPNLRRLIDEHQQRHSASEPRAHLSPAAASERRFTTASRSMSETAQPFDFEALPVAHEIDQFFNTIKDAETGTINYTGENVERAQSLFEQLNATVQKAGITNFTDVPQPVFDRLVALTTFRNQSFDRAKKAVESIYGDQASEAQRYQEALKRPIENLAVVKSVMATNYAWEKNQRAVETQLKEHREKLALEAKRAQQAQDEMSLLKRKYDEMEKEITTLKGALPTHVSDALKRRRTDEPAEAAAAAVAGATPMQSVASQASRPAPVPLPNGVKTVAAPFAAIRNAPSKNDPAFQHLVNSNKLNFTAAAFLSEYAHQNKF